MSDILQRTIASLPGLLAGVAGGGQGSGASRALGGPHGGPRGGRGPFDVSSGMLNFIQSICNVRSKYAEEQLVKRELSLQKQKLSNPAQTNAQKRDSLLRLLYCHLLGYDVSFAYIQAVKLAQQGSILEKRVGYLLCDAFLEDSHELSMLVINTILKDLSSTSILEVCIALVAAGHLVSSEMIPSVLPSVNEKLRHSKEIIRRKAVLCLRAFFLKAPALASQLRPSLNTAIGDKDPGVMWAALEAFRDLIRHDESAYLDIVPALVDITEQIISRKLPSQFDYHTVPSPWLTITILKLLATLGKAEESARKQISPILQDVLQRTEPSSNAGLAVIYEALVAIAVINADSYLMSLAAKCVSRFLSSKKINLRYIGIKVLSVIVQTDDRYALDHQSAVIDCLEHQDVTIQKTTLHLLCNMANPVNKQVICDQLLSYAERTHDQFARVDIVTKILDIADRLSDDVIWYIDQVMQVLETNGDVVPARTSNRLIQIIKSGCRGDDKILDRNRCEHALKLCWQKLKHETLSEPLLKVAVWVVGEYCHLDPVLTPDSFTASLVDWYRRCPKANLRKWILSALCKQRRLIEQPMKILEALQSASDPNDRLLQQRLHEFAVLCSLSPAVKDNLSFQSSSTPVDFSLSFLDDFVSEALESGSLPYRTASLRLSQTISQKSKDVSSSVVSDLIVESSDGSLSSLLFDIAAAKKPSSLPSSESTETSGTGKKETVGLQMKGVRVVWGKEGLCEPAANQQHGNETEQVNFTSNDVKDLQDIAGVDTIRKTEERKALAKALFSGISTPLKEEKKTDNAALNSSNSDFQNSDAKAHLKERSISPDSIESLSDTDSPRNNFCHENLISGISAADVLRTDSSEHKTNPAINESFSLSASQDLVSQTIEKNPAEDSLLRLYFEEAVSSKSLSNSWNCYSKSRSHRAEISRSSSEKHISLDNPVGSCTTREDLDNNLVNCNSRTGQNSESVIRSGKDLPAALKPAEELRAQHKTGAIGNSQCKASLPIGPCIGVFSCDKISVFCQKRYLEKSLQLTLTFFHSDTSGFANASVSIVRSSAQFFSTKFITEEALVDDIFLNELSCEDRPVEALLSVAPANMQSICDFKQSSVDLLLSLPHRELRKVINIPISLTDFVRPRECSLQEFAEFWNLLPQECQRVSSCDMDVIESVVHRLSTLCRLHVVKISGNECLLAGKTLDSDHVKILLHVRLVDSEKGFLLHLWMKSTASVVLDDIMSTITTAFSD